MPQEFSVFPGSFTRQDSFSIPDRLCSYARYGGEKGRPRASRELLSILRGFNPDENYQFAELNEHIKVLISALMNRNSWTPFRILEGNFQGVSCNEQSVLELAAGLAIRYGTKQQNLDYGDPRGIYVSTYELQPIKVRFISNSGYGSTSPLHAHSEIHASVLSMQFGHEIMSQREIR